jgi:hypothetical protein
MEAEFFNVSSEARRASRDPESTNLRELKAALKRWERTLNECDAQSRAMFYDMNASDMNRIAATLRRIKDPAVTGFHDRIFTNILGVPKRIPSDLSRVFHELIKGVTYFAHQTTIEVPPYHRLSACGPGHDAFRNEFNRCTPDMDRARRDDVRKRIETCYVERLMYNEMFTRFSLHFPSTGTQAHEQDEGHLHRLKLTREDFKTCFPNLDFKVDIEFEANWPRSVRICRFLHGDLVSVEVYERRIEFPDGSKRYEPVCYASRRTQQFAYVKNQSFEYPTNWKRVGANSAGLSSECVHAVMIV